MFPSARKPKKKQKKTNKTRQNDKDKTIIESVYISECNISTEATHY